MGIFFIPTTFATWKSDSNGLYNEPIIVAGNIITNGNMETWSTATNAGTWTEILSGTSTVNRDSSVVYEGSFSCRFDVDSLNSAVKMSSAISATQNRWIKVVHNWNINSGSATVGFQPSVSNLLCSGEVRSISAGGWTQFYDTGFVVNNAIGPVFNPVSAASKSIYLDGITGNYIDDAAIMAICSGQGVNDTVSIKAKTLKIGTHVAVAGWVNGQSKTSYIMALHDGINIRLIKCVSGSATWLISEAVSFVSNASLEIRRPSGNNFEVWYNGSKVGTTQTVNDAAIINNTYSGIVSTDSINRISEYRVGSNFINSFFGLFTDYSDDNGFQILRRNNLLIAVTQETNLLPYIQTGWTINSNGLLGGTGLLLTQPNLVGTTSNTNAGIRNYTAASEVGIISNADSTTPTNYLKAYYNGTQVKLDKVVAGVTTNLISSITSFVADALIEIVRTGQATFQLKYNGVQIGTNQTVNDAAIQSAGRSGLYSTNSANRFNNLFVNGNNLPFYL